MRRIKHGAWLVMLVLTSCTKAIIDEGSIEELKPITFTVTYNSHIESIMFNYCITCHAGSAPQGGLDLTTYDQVRFNTESGSLADRVNNTANPMPPSGLIAPRERQLIEKWIQDGFPQ